MYTVTGKFFHVPDRPSQDAWSWLSSDASRLVYAKLPAQNRTNSMILLTKALANLPFNFSCGHSWFILALQRSLGTCMYGRRAVLGVSPALWESEYAEIQLDAKN